MRYLKLPIIIFLIFIANINFIWGQNPITLKVFKLPDPKATDAYSRAEKAVVRAFKEKYPHIELKSFSGIQIEDLNMDAGPLMAIAGGVSPDVIYVNFRQSDTYIQNNFLYPLDEFVKRVPEEELEGRVADPVWPVIKRKKDNEEHIWAFPYETLVRVLMYRKDLFARVGLDPDSPPDNWDEMYRYARQLTIPHEGIYGMHLASGPQAAYDWITYLWSAGGRAVTRIPGTDNWEATFNSEAGVDALEYYLKLNTTKWKDSYGRDQEGFVIREGDWGRMWDDGKIAMQMSYMNEKSLGGNIDPDLYGLAPPPAGPHGDRGSEINCRMMGIFAGAGISNNSGLGDRDPFEVREAAWKFIHFYDSEEARKIRLKVMIEAGYGRMQNPLYLKKYGYDEVLRFVPEGWFRTFEESINNGKPEPYGRNCQKVYEFMTYPIDDCIALEQKGQLGDTREEKRAKIKEILDAAVNRTNEKMIGTISPEERKKRNSIAVFVAIFIMIFFTTALVLAWKTFDHKPAYQSKRKNNKFLVIAYLMIIPAVGSILLWKYIPMLMGSMMAFQDYQVVGNSEWIGLQNFADVLFDSVWWSSLWRTLQYMILSLGLGFVPPIILAIMLQEVSHGKILYRLIYYLPAVISGVIVIYLWKLLYDPSDAGGLNQILLALGFESSKWIKDESLAMVLCILPTIWAGVGPGCLIYLAALKGIPDENYEAADIDGATFFQKIRFIVVPSLKSLIIIQFIAAFIASAQQSGFILVMTAGGPNEATKVADLLIFEKAYLYLKFGVATTMAWMLGIMLMGFTIIQLRKISKMEFKTVNSD